MARDFTYHWKLDSETFQAGIGDQHRSLNFVRVLD